MPFRRRDGARLALIAWPPPGSLVIPRWALVFVTFAEDLNREGFRRLDPATVFPFERRAPVDRGRRERVPGPRAVLGRPPAPAEQIRSAAAEVFEHGTGTRSLWPRQSKRGGRSEEGEAITSSRCATGPWWGRRCR